MDKTLGNLLIYAILLMLYYKYNILFYLKFVIDYDGRNNKNFKFITNYRVINVLNVTYFAIKFKKQYINNIKNIYFNS